MICDECPGPEKRRFTLQVHITSRCNLRCLHCYDGNHLPVDMDKGMFSGVLEQFSDLLDRMEGMSGGQYHGRLNITGGEPLLHPDLPDLIEMVKGKGPRFSFSILTNGTLLDRKTVKMLSSVEPAFAQVSIDGDQAHHDRMRGRGAYAKAVNGLALLKENNIPSMISFTANCDNYRMFPSVATLGSRMGCLKVWADRTVPIGAGRVFADSLMSSDETRKFLNIMAKCKKRFEKKGATRIAMERSLQFLAAHDVPYRCNAGKHLLTVMENGDVLPCRRLPLVVGNVKEKDLPEIYVNAPILSELRDDTPPAECGSCLYSGICMGGSRCISYAVYNDLHRADHGCWLKNKKNGGPANETPLEISQSV